MDVMAGHAAYTVKVDMFNCLYYSILVMFMYLFLHKLR